MSNIKHPPLLQAHPDLAIEWHTDKNGELPETLTLKAGRRAWWLCEHGHTWRARVADRTNGGGCPECRRSR